MSTFTREGFERLIEAHLIPALKILEDNGLSVVAVTATASREDLETHFIDENTIGETVNIGSIHWFGDSFGQAVCLDNLLQSERTLTLIDASAEIGLSDIISRPSSTKI